jgi:hypothetical protein
LRGLRRGGLSVTLLPNQGRGLVEAMGFVSFCVVNQRFIVQLADYKIVSSRTWQQISASHRRPALIFI